MRTQFLIEAEMYSQSGILHGAEEFLRRFSVYARGRTTIFIFPDERIWRDALELLARYGMKAETFYSFHLDPEEVIDYPAFYFSVEVAEDLLINHSVVDVSRLGANDIAKDYASESIVVRPHVRELLEGLVQRVSWMTVSSSDGRDLWLMNITERLPQPIIVPLPVYVGPNQEPPGTYAVRSDGRDVITSDNISKLENVGLAASEIVQIPLATLRWRPRLVASGDVIHILQGAGMKGLLIEPLSPLLRESHPLAF